MSGPIAFIKRMVDEKREYRQQVARAKALPSDYYFVYDKIQHYMWNYASGTGTDMTRVHAGILDLFEEGAAAGKNVLEITGTDVAAFCDELLRNTQTYTGDWHAQLNRDVLRHLGQEEKSDE